MKDYSVEIHAIWQIKAKDEDQAYERATALSDAITLAFTRNGFPVIAPGWVGDQEPTEVTDVQEI